MKKNKLKMLLLLHTLVLYACTNQNNIISNPVPIKKENDEPIQSIKISEIIETQDGPGAAHLPNWLISFLNGGIAEVEQIDSYQSRYLFIGRNKGVNFIALNKWAESFTVANDFPRLAAVRIEKRLIATATQYPDYEYGDFYEALVKRAFGGEYPNAIKEETYWIKRSTDEEYDAGTEGLAAYPEVYEFFVFISIDKITMQGIIRAMMTDTLASVAPTRIQTAAINRMRQIFFEGF